MRLPKLLHRSEAAEDVDNTGHFRLLDLPPELRNIIYKSFFEDGDPRNLAFLATCKQVRREAFVLALDRTIMYWKSHHFMCHKTEFRPHWLSANPSLTRRYWDRTFRDAVTTMHCEILGHNRRFKWPLISLMLKYAGVYPKHIVAMVMNNQPVGFELGPNRDEPLFRDGQQFFHAVRHFTKKSSRFHLPAALNKVLVYHCMFSQFLQNPRLQSWELQRYASHKQLDWTMRLERDGGQDPLVSHTMPPYSIIDAEWESSRLLGVDVEVLEGWSGNEDMLVRVWHPEGIVGGCTRERVCVRMSLLMSGEPNEEVNTD